MANNYSLGYFGLDTSNGNNVSQIAARQLSEMIEDSAGNIILDEVQKVSILMFTSAVYQRMIIEQDFNFDQLWLDCLGTVTLETDEEFTFLSDIKRMIEVISSEDGSQLLPIIKALAVQLQW
jgi:hypothetical protein